MVWIPTGMLRAGTPLDEVPRVADEELAGRGDAAGRLLHRRAAVARTRRAPSRRPTCRATRRRGCATRKSKRLCTELEWERACKGPDNTRYEYGDDLRRRRRARRASRPSASARHPSGDRTACQSGFGVREMHGGAWEWTDSPWGRGASARRRRRSA